MKFGKLTDIRGVDFSLPEDNPRSLATLGAKPDTDFSVQIGLPRWSSKEWLGTIYPSGTRQADFLKAYARVFNGIELNSTHYRIPSATQVEKWRDMTGPDFRFSPKIPQVISHYRKLVNCSEEIHQFASAISHFEDRLGWSFLQLPEHFSPASLGNLQSFFGQWPRELPLAVEFRHPDWFQHNLLLPAVWELLAAHHAGAVITDVAGRRDVLHLDLPVPMAMVRFVGNDHPQSDLARLEAWMKKFGAWKARGLQSIYFFVHQPGDVPAAAFGKRVQDAFETHLGVNFESAPSLADDQLSLF